MASQELANISAKDGFLAMGKALFCKGLSDRQIDKIGIIGKVCENLPSPGRNSSATFFTLFSRERRYDNGNVNYFVLLCGDHYRSSNLFLKKDFEVL